MTVPDKRIETLLTYATTGSDGLVKAPMWKSELNALLLEVKAARSVTSMKSDPLHKGAANKGRKE